MNTQNLTVGCYVRNRKDNTVWFVANVLSNGKPDLFRYGQKYQNIPTAETFSADYEPVPQDAIRYDMDQDVNYYCPIRGERVYYKFTELIEGENRKRGANTHGYALCTVDNVYWKAGRLRFDIVCTYGEGGKYQDIVCGTTVNELRPAIITIA